MSTHIVDHPGIELVLSSEGKNLLLLWPPYPSTSMRGPLIIQTLMAIVLLKSKGSGVHPIFWVREIRAKYAIYMGLPLTFSDEDVLWLDDNVQDPSLLAW
jgi:hypothetical protein